MVTGPSLAATARAPAPSQAALRAGSGVNLIAPGGYSRNSAEPALTKGAGDPTAFVCAWLANPDLIDRTNVEQTEDLELIA
jgi:hypothetical protein